MDTVNKIVKYSLRGFFVRYFVLWTLDVWLVAGTLEMLLISKNKLRNLLHGADCSQRSAGLCCSAAVKTGRGQLSRVFRAATALKIVDGFNCWGEGGSVAASWRSQHHLHHLRSSRNWAAIKCRNEHLVRQHGHRHILGHRESGQHLAILNF